MIQNMFRKAMASDDATLSIDFSTGTLPSGMTFTRTTNATFINSQGYVEYAGANILLQGSNLGSAIWTATGLTSRNASTDPNGSNEAVELSEDQTTGEHRVLQLTSQNLNGLVYTSSVYMKAGTNRTVGFIRDNSVSSDALVFYTLTGSGSATIANGSYGIVASITRVGTTDWYRCVFTIKAAGIANVHIGTAIGTANGNWSFAGTVGNSIHVWGAQVNLGSTVQTYYPTTTAANTNTPRFDYDPTTLTPRGLLIEGTATNLLNWSESFATSGGASNNWADTNITRNSTNNTDPANGTTALRVTASAGNGTIISTAAIGTSAARTFSVWLRRVSGTGNIQYTLDNGSTYTTQAITSSWVRYTFAATTAAQRVGIRIVTSGDSIELWGAQLEAGSGASSYIPTGASQGTREADFAVLSNLSAIGFNTAGGSLAMRGYQTKLSSGSYPALAAFLDSGDVDVFGIRNDVAGAVMFGRFAGTSTSGEANRTITNNAAYAFAMSVNPALTTSAIIVSMNGSSTTANKSGSATAISTPTKFALTRPGYGLYINCGAITSIKYWPTVKTAAELNAITT